MQRSYEQRKIWDPLIRIWHWLLLITVTAGWLLGQYRDFDTIDYHMYLGYSTGVLLLIRILWGFAGPPPVRFSALAVTPADLIAYLRDLPSRSPSGMSGHNPVGALSAIAILVALATQVITGLFSEDDGLFSQGPLAYWVSDSMRGAIGHIHHVCARVILFLVGLHVAAILFYLVWKRENLIKPMITGWKTVRRDR